jgi:hypothetical protein
MGTALVMGVGHSTLGSWGAPGSEFRALTLGCVGSGGCCVDVLVQPSL